jgi:hypothetical protein
MLGGGELSIWCKLQKTLKMLLESFKTTLEFVSTKTEEEETTGKKTQLNKKT